MVIVLSSKARLRWGILAILFIGLSWNSSATAVEAAPPADSGVNAITMRFDTIHVQPGQSNVLMPVYWSYSLPKPHNFNGFNVHFSVDSNRITIVQFLTSGTASEQMGTPFTNTKANDARFVMLGSGEPDFSRKILFFVNVTARLNPGERTPFHWTYAEDPHYFGVDTIIQQDGWIQLDSAKHVALTARDTTVQSDSSVTLPIAISDLGTTNIKDARLALDIDTTALVYVSSQAGATVNASMTAQYQAPRLTLDFSTTSGSMNGNDVLASITLKARKRTDTACVAWTNPTFTALNSSAYVGQVSFSLGNICVLGQTDSMEAVALSNRPQSCIYPNPARTAVTLDGGEIVRAFCVTSAFGERVYTGTRMSTWRIPDSIANGMYTITIEQENGTIARQKIVVER